MNAHFFGTKRAFHGILRVMRRPLALFGLTSARYDMLVAIFGSIPKPEYYGALISQRELPHRLGVHKSVVSRMVRSLEQIGLVARTRFQNDKRQFWVKLTQAGRDRLRDAAQCLMRASKRLLCMAICFGRWRDPKARFQHMDGYEPYLRAMRWHYGDKAWLPYRWHPDD